MTTKKIQTRQIVTSQTKNVKTNGVVVKKNVSGVVRGQISVVDVKPTPAIVVQKPVAQLPDNYSNISKLNLLKLPSGEARQSKKRYSPYEKLAGISIEVPELISTFSFEPIVKHGNNNSSTKTPAGLYVDDQITMRELQLQNVISFLSKVSSDQDVEKTLKDRFQEFYKTLYETQLDTALLFDVIIQIERTKSYLDLRNDVHKVDPSQVAASYFYFKSFLEAGSEIVNPIALQPFDVGDVLVQLGFNPTSVNQSYSSTKLWLQMLIEFKEIIRTHSLGLFDSISAQYKYDKSAGNLIKPTRNRFDVSLIDTYSIDQINSLESSQIETAIKGLTVSYIAMYSGATLKSDEHQFAALANLASREYRLSKGLAKSNVQMTLKQMGYTVVPNGNLAILDTIIGMFTDSISDVPDDVTQSLASVALQKPDNNTAVLTFEEKYVQGDNGTLTPGSEYYVESVTNLKNNQFNTEKLNNFTTIFTKAYKNFLTLSTGLNLTMSPADVVGSNGNVFNDPYVNPRLLFETIVRNMIDGSGKMFPTISSDPICSVFSHARTFNGLSIKSALFILVNLLINNETTSNVQKNNATIDSVANHIVNYMQLSTTQGKSDFKNERTSPGVVNDIVSREKFLAGLKGTSPALRVAVQIMKNCKILFESDVLVNGHTRYSGYSDSVIMMVVFELVVGCISKYSNQKLVSYINDNRERSFGITRSSQSIVTSITEVATRLNREVIVNMQVVFTILNTLSKLFTSSTSLITTLENESSKNGLNKITNLLNDQTLINVLFKKQPILSLVSTFLDLSIKNVDTNNISLTQNTYVKTDSDGDYNFGDGLQVFDERFIPPKLKNSIFGVFSNDQFSTEKAINKRILTVGIPVGLTEHLQQLVDLRTTNGDDFSDKQSDVVYVNIHKIDLKNPDIIFKPIKKLFELSRFPVRNVLEQPNYTNFSEYIEKFPTRDFTQVYETMGNASDMQYLVPGTGQTAAFDDDSYSFLSLTQKREIIENTVLSYLLEKYIQLTTGFSVDERSFSFASFNKLMNDVDISMLIQSAVNLVISSQENNVDNGKNSVFFGSTPETFQQISQITNAVLTKKINLSAIQQSSIETLSQYMKTIDTMSLIQTPLIDSNIFKKKMLTPCKFDRVLSIIVDPDDFVVDTYQTYQTSEGRTALTQLIREDKFFVTTTTDSEQQTYYSPKPRDTKQGDISFEKYFISISTFGDINI